MKSKKPVSYKDLAMSSSPPHTPMEAVERITANIEQLKGELMEDQKFLYGLIKNAVENPDSFVREKKGEPSAAEKKEKRHSLKGRTNKIKFTCYFSDKQMKQLWSLVEHRGDRSPSDMVNQILCTGLVAMETL